MPSQTCLSQKIAEATKRYAHRTPVSVVMGEGSEKASPSSEKPEAPIEVKLFDQIEETMVQGLLYAVKAKAQNPSEENRPGVEIFDHLVNGASKRSCAC